MARINGEKSWEKLIIEAYGRAAINHKLNIHATSELFISPLSFMLAGYYQNKDRTDRENFGDYWTKNARILEFTLEILRPNASYNRWTFSNSLRCAAQVINKNCL